MKLVKRFIIFLSVLWLGTCGLRVSPASASTEFTVAYAIRYEFNATGHSTVKHTITLTNQLTGVMPSVFTLTVKGEGEGSIRAYDDQGPLEITTTTPSLNTTAIKVQIAHPTPGKGKQTRFTVEYAGRPAIRTGQVWEVILGRLADPSTADTYDVTLSVPDSFGHPAYMSPPPASAQTVADRYEYLFTKDQVVQSGLVAGFGNFQTLDFNLQYHLQNPANQSQLQTIALPPDTYTQRIFFDSLDPRPETIRVDADGNWLADYRLASNKSQLIVAKGQVHLLGSPVNPSRVQPTNVELQSTLKPTEDWPIYDPMLSALASELKTPRAIYDYVVKNFDYDYNRAFSKVQRKGALSALADPKTSICTEFTDTFVALARAAGIPAREHQGFALGNDPKLQPLGLVADVLHAWPEYWDAQAQVWRSVDPTWAKTSGGANYFDSLDLSHFTFVIHGADSRQPLPAGLYKTSPDSKDVQVAVGEYKDYFAGPPEITWHLPTQLVPFLALPGYIEISNSNSSALYDLGIKLNHSDIPAQLATQVVRVLPPFSRIRVPIQLKSPVGQFATRKQIIVSVGSHLVAYNVPNNRFIVWYAILILTLVLTLIILAGLTVKAGNLYLQRRSRQTSLRR